MIASKIDLTYLKMDITGKILDELRFNTKKYGFRSLVIPPTFVDLVLEDKKDIRLTTVVSFPLGKETLKYKVKEALALLDQGVDEVDIVSNISYVLENKYEKYENEVKTLVSSVKDAYPDRIVKIICEITMLKPKQILKVLKIINSVRPDFFKTSTGFGIRGVSIGDIVFIRRHLSNEIGLKASGGIRSFMKARKILEAGADILGSSSGLKIISEENRWYSSHEGE